MHVYELEFKQLSQQWPHSNVDGPLRPLPETPNIRSHTWDCVRYEHINYMCCVEREWYSVLLETQLSRPRRACSIQEDSGF